MDALQEPTRTTVEEQILAKERCPSQAMRRAPSWTPYKNQLVGVLTLQLTSLSLPQAQNNCILS